MYLLSTSRITPVVSAFETESVSMKLLSDSVPALLTKSPLSNWIAGARPLRCPPQPKLILTGTTRPFWTRLDVPSLSGSRKLPFQTVTAVEVKDVETPPSLSFASAATV